MPSPCHHLTITIPSRARLADERSRLGREIDRCDRCGCSLSRLGIPSRGHHCTITVPSLHHHCIITAPSLHHNTAPHHCTTSLHHHCKGPFWGLLGYSQGTAMTISYLAHAPPNTFQADQHHTSTYYHHTITVPAPYHHHTKHFPGWFGLLCIHPDNPQWPRGPHQQRHEKVPCFVICLVVLMGMSLINPLIKYYYY